MAPASPRLLPRVLPKSAPESSPVPSAGIRAAASLGGDRSTGLRFCGPAHTCTHVPRPQTDALQVGGSQSPCPQHLSCLLILGTGSQGARHRTLAPRPGHPRSQTWWGPWPGSWGGDEPLRPPPRPPSGRCRMQVSAGLFRGAQSARLCACTPAESRMHRHAPAFRSAASLQAPRASATRRVVLDSSSLPPLVRAQRATANNEIYFQAQDRAFSG